MPNNPKTVTVEIPRRLTGEAIFTAEVDAGIEERFRMRAALEAGVRAEANLMSANLEGADLAGAKLGDAVLPGATFVGADLAGADLSGAELDGANLSGADLAGADLDSADLSSVHLVGAKNILCAGPCDGWIMYLIRGDDGDHRLQAGCHWFTQAEARTHWNGENHAEHDAKMIAGIDALLALARAEGWSGRSGNLGAARRPLVPPTP